MTTAGQTLADSRRRIPIVTESAHTMIVNTAALNQGSLVANRRTRWRAHAKAPRRHRFVSKAMDLRARKQGHEVSRANRAPPSVKAAPQDAERSLIATTRRGRSRRWQLLMRPMDPSGAVSVARDAVRNQSDDRRREIRNRPDTSVPRKSKTEAMSSRRIARSAIASARGSTSRQRCPRLRRPLDHLSQGNALEGPADRMTTRVDRRRAACTIARHLRRIMQIAHSPEAERRAPGSGGRLCRAASDRAGGRVALVLSPS